MGKISQTLTGRFRKHRKFAQQLHQQAKQDAVQVPKDVRSVQQLVEHEGYDPLHAAYISAQNLASFFVESVSAFDEFNVYWDIVEPAQDEYMPSGPPISPLTVSYFTTWAMFDVRFGPDQETMGTCLLDIAECIKMDELTVGTIRNFQTSRMGIYEHCGRIASRIQLRELITEDEFECIVPAGYAGKKGELWFARRCPPLHDLFDYHVIFTTPYILTQTSKSDWTAYLNKSILETDNTDRRTALYDVLKYGREPRHWSEFIFLGYHHHQPEAIFLAGLPDVKGSLPHAD